MAGVFSYFLLISLLSLLLCHILLKNILPNRPINIAILTSAFALVYIVFGVGYFGQREQIALILTAPYFLLLTLRLEKKKVSNYLYILVGILGGIGFAAKPHFCIPFFLAEIYLAIKNKRLSTLFRTESIIVVSIFIVYLISTYLLYPAFFKIIVPLSMKFYYYGSDNDPFWKNFFIIKMGYCYVTIWLYLLARKVDQQSINLINFLFIAEIGYILSYLAGISPWDYHLFPGFCFAMILNIYFIYLLALKKDFTKKQTFQYIFFALFAFIYSRFYLGEHLFYTLYAFIFCISIYCQQYFLKRTLHIISILSLLALTSIYPIYVGYAMYQNQQYVKDSMQPLTQYLHKHAYKKTVYFISSIMPYEWLTVDYAGAIHVSRFPYLLWIPSYLKAYTTHPYTQASADIFGINIFFIKLMAHDIEVKKPQFIFVDSSEFKNTLTIAYTHFSYLKLFMQNPEFRAAWKNYHYYGSITDNHHYLFKVYEINKALKK
jgi:hypothetical protein